MTQPALSAAASRHHWLWLSAAGWQRLQQACADARQRAVLCHWQDMQWPLVVRRADAAAAAADEICVGIALPPDAQGNKPRIALRVQATEVVARHAPFLLRDIVAANLPGLPAGWLPAMAELQQQMAEAGIGLAVFGSLAWQAVTAQAYVRSSSDIDLLFHPRDRAELEAGVALLARQAALLPMLPLDGEIVFPDGAAVSWKEWRQAAVQGGSRVLVKRADTVALESGRSLIDSLAQAGQPARQAVPQEPSCVA